MLSSESVQWVQDNYPGLRVNDERTSVSGTVKLTATYNSETGKFLNLTNGQANSVGGLVLDGNITIDIQQREQTTWSRLPALFLDIAKEKLIAKRHFNDGSDKSACLCGLFEEQNFLSEDFKFDNFFESLVIPFLYGQLFYEKFQKWPWPDYAHGAAGLLESYYNVNDITKTKLCIVLLEVFLKNSPVILKNILQPNKQFNGHTLCICGSGKLIRNCHPLAWRGIFLLKKNMISIQQVKVTKPIRPGINADV